MAPFSRRALLAALASSSMRAHAAEVAPRTLEFPRDHGAHLDFGVEWWYATGWLQDTAGSAPGYGFQLTFFRSRTGLAQDVQSRFAARQLLFAHAALADIGQRRFAHAERIARWTGEETSERAAASARDTNVHIGRWSLQRDAAGAYRAAIGDESAQWSLALALAPTQPLLLQGDAGFSRKGPRPDNASHYYSQPQLAVQGELTLDAATRRTVRGRAWLDHEWSGSLMPAGAVGWDWIGMNLDDGSALTAFRLRDANGAPVWAGGSWRAGGSSARAFAAGEVRFEPLAWWTSAATRARYATRWRITCPAGVYEVRALLDAQELDGRTSTGSIYWEGLSELLAADGRRVGLGYLEMTGYASPLRLTN
jgi:predicted secreted hydrolase